MAKLLVRYKYLLLYAVALALLILFFQILQYKFILLKQSLELYILIIAVLFTCLGIWLALQLVKPKQYNETVIIEKDINQEKSIEQHKTTVDATLQQLHLSAREYEVLQLMAQGCSNVEIAHQLYLSVPTIKTHVSKIFEKLDVKRRTQAVEKARKLHLLT